MLAAVTVTGGVVVTVVVVGVVQVEVGVVVVLGTLDSQTKANCLMQEMSSQTPELSPSILTQSWDSLIELSELG